MKKLLLIGLILAICILAFPHGVMAANTDQATVSATVNTVTDITAKLTDPTAWALNRGSATENDKDNAINVTVDCNGDWTVTPTDVNTGATKGFMLSGVTKLTDAFKLEKGQGTGSFDVLTGPSWVTQTGNTQPATNYYYNVRQQIEAGDDAYNTYQIVIKFTLGAS